MRIISKHKDYYDGLMDYSKDRVNKVWVRQPREVRELNRKLTVPQIDDSHFFWGWKVDLQYVVVAGKVYPVVIYHNARVSLWDRRRHPWLEEKAELSFYYSLEEFDKDHPEETRTQYNKRHAKVGYAKGEIKPQWFKFFREYKDETDLCLQYNTPLMVINPVNRDELELYIDPLMNYYQFYKVLDVYQMYQQLDYFVSNVMVSDEMPGTNQTDMEKVHSHGFDKVYGFRKRKKE